ncbi:ATP-binding protein [Streptomyces sp. TRM66268-LWL]|uniref:ATP-binding protein n=1 Tax=Streptomyces polyasparticus TaxID=2767826 RepID=A0ABR7SV41_9ACTN|nr:ATP-binding protein [Streptomyces polyasparticus]MBC9719268.1 ATP-binding protein [Streptomyces polyasparticus]
MIFDAHSGQQQGVEEVLLSVPFAARDVPRLRVLVEGYASLAGLPEQRRGDFVVAMDAVAGNVVQHGGGHGLLVLARAHCHELRCRISDRGPGFTAEAIPDLAVGINGAGHGQGLWLTRLITDDLTVIPKAVGTTVVFAMRWNR